MLFLNEDNQIMDTDSITSIHHYCILDMKNPKDMDFRFIEMTEVQEFSSSPMQLDIGPYQIFAPIHWSIMFFDGEYVQSMPIHEISGRTFDIFCLNPIDSFFPYYHPIRVRGPFPKNNWTCPGVKDKELLVVPLGDPPNGKGGPICAIFSPSKLEIQKPLSDIW